MKPEISPAEQIPQPANVASAHILVVDDDARIARMLAATLATAGHRTAIATDGEQAQQLIERDVPDLVLCDICLPGLNGIDLTRWIRQREASRSIPVLLITSVDDRKLLTRGLEAGADDFLTKPINAVELNTRVVALLRSQIVTEELRAREAAAAPFSVSALHEEEGHPAAEYSAQDSASKPHPPANILLVDDNAQECRLMEAHLHDVDCQITTVGNAEAALDALQENHWDLVILDLVLPDHSGYALIEQMRESLTHAQTPILVVSCLSDVQARVKALELGADDFIVKGFDHLEFEARVRRLLRLKRHLDQLAVRCDRALRQAVTDSLTGLYTHGLLQDTLQRQIACARRYTWPLSLLFIDIDHFKQINDRYGHAMGDEVLRALADTIRNSIRPADTAVRYGGEEFVVLMPHTTRQEAETVAERLRSQVERLEVPIPKTRGSASLRLTVSSGVASFPDDAADAATLLEHADEAMYLAKQGGRNRVTVFGSAKAAPSGQPKILLVDDDPRNLRLLDAYLRPESYETIRATNGAEAIEIARRQQPDLVLLDGMMPGLSGFDVCRRLKQESGTRLMPIILITALNSREDRLRGIEAGADEFLTKPVDKVELLTRMRALLRSKRNTDSLEDAETVIFTLARAVESRDPSTGGHVERVSHYAVALGKAIGLPEPQTEGLRRAGVVHDIGKIAVPDAILLKPGQLTPEERKIIESHVEVGYELLRPMRTFAESLPAVRFHHERLDGSGYPLGLRGSQVPVIAQIMAITDVYDALTTDRVYRKALSQTQALEILREEADRGLHDRELIETFARTVLTAPAPLVMPVASFAAAPLACLVD